MSTRGPMCAGGSRRTWTGTQPSPSELGPLLGYCAGYCCPDGGGHSGLADRSLFYAGRACPLLIRSALRRGTMWILNNPYFQNTASSLITVAVLTIVGIAVYRLSHRRRLLGFFGCLRTRKVNLYLSNLDIIYGGAADPEGLPRAYRGPSTPGYELPFIPVIYNLFMALVPGLSSQPGIWKYLATRDLEVAISPAPKSAEDIDDEGTLVSVGSIGYNTVSKEIESNFNPSARLDPDNGYIAISEGKVFSGPGYAFIQRCRHSRRNQWAFYVAGSTRIGTTAAFTYLMFRWDKLRRTYQNATPFCIVIRVIDGDPSRCEVVYRSPVSQVRMRV